MKLFFIWDMLGCHYYTTSPDVISVLLKGHSYTKIMLKYTIQPDQAYEIGEI